MTDISILLKAVDQASRELQQIEKELKDVDKAGGGAGSGAEKANKGFANMTGAIKGLAAGFIGAAIVQKLKDIGKEAINAASDVEEMTSKFNVVFGETAPQVTKALEEFGEEVNRSRFDLMEMASTLQDTFVPMGFARDQAADLSIELTKLATDVASFNNANDTDVIRDFQSALVGNHETVRKYGIVITETTLKQEAYRRGIAEVGSELTEQQKVQARLALITAGTADAQGDAARTADSYANLQKGLEAATKDLMVVIGEGLIPIMTDATETTMELLDVVMPGAQAWRALSIAMDEGRASTFQANLAFAEMVFTGKTATQVIEEFAAEEREVAQVSEAELAAALEAGRKAIDGWAEAARRAQTPADELAKSIGGAADQLGNLSRAELGRELLADLEEQADDIGQARYEEMFRDIAGGMLGIPEAEVEAALALDRIKDDLDDTNASIEDAVFRLDSFARSWEALQNLEDMDLKVILSTNQQISQGSTFQPSAPPPPPHPGTSNPGGGGFQHGADFMVPSGFPNDSFPFRATTGERVIVIPNNTINIHQAPGQSPHELLNLLMERMGDQARRSSFSGARFAGR